MKNPKHALQTQGFYIALDFNICHLLSKVILQLYKLNKLLSLLNFTNCQKQVSCSGDYNNNNQWMV